jgi:hypothetical protein
MPHAACEKADPNDSVADDHHRGEKGVSCQSGCFRAARNHHGDDERYLDGCDRESQHQCAEGFTDTKRDNLSMIDSGENGGDQCKCFRWSERTAGPEYEVRRQND